MNAPELLAYALHARSLGLSVLPPKEDGTKAPLADRRDENGKATWKPYQAMPASEQRVRGWYRSGRRHGFGLVTGKVSGNLEVLDFDDADTYAAFVGRCETSGLSELVRRIRAGYESRTPGGAAHWLYRCSEISGNTKLAQRADRETQIETRGEGGFAIEPPTGGPVHPSGKPYELISGSLDTIPTITPDERRELHRIARTFDQLPQREESTRQERRHEAAGEPSGDRAGDDFNQRADWADILESHGWRFVFESGDVAHWRRPGKDHGISATTNYAGSGLLYVFSTSTAFEAERGYSKFSAYALLNHGEDYVAAARELRARGYGRQAEPEPEASPAPEDLAAEYERLRAAYAALEDQLAAAIEDRDHYKARAEHHQERADGAEAKATARGRMLDAIAQYVAMPELKGELRLLIGLELAHYRHDPALELIAGNRWRLTQKLARSLCGVRSVVTAGNYARALARLGLLPLGEPEIKKFTKRDGTKVDAEVLTYFYDPPDAKPDRQPDAIAEQNRPVLLARARRLQAKREARGDKKRFSGCPDHPHARTAMRRHCSVCDRCIEPKAPNVFATAPASRPDQGSQGDPRFFDAKPDRQPPCKHGRDPNKGVYCIDCHGRECGNCGLRRPGTRGDLCSVCKAAVAVEFAEAVTD